MAERKEGFRDGMTPAELAVQIRSMTEHFKPQVIELIKSAQRWDWCVANEFPQRTKLVETELAWRVRRHADNIFITDTYYGSTPEEAVGRALTDEEGGGDDKDDGDDEKDVKPKET